MEDPEFKRQMEEHISAINKEYGVAEGDMHGLEDDLDLGFDGEEVPKEFDSEAYQASIKEEIKRINAEYGLDENEMHGLDLDGLDYEMGKDELNEEETAALKGKF